MRNRKERDFDIQILELELKIEDMKYEIEETYDDRRRNFLIKKKAQEEQRLEDMREMYNRKPMKPMKVPKNYDSRLLR